MEIGTIHFSFNLSQGRQVNEKNGGGDGDRTHDPFHAMEVLSQLSYAPSGLTADGNSNENRQKNKPN